MFKQLLTLFLVMSPILSKFPCSCMHITLLHQNSLLLMLLAVNSTQTKTKNTEAFVIRLNKVRSLFNALLGDGLANYITHFLTNSERNPDFIHLSISD